jgi:hypothetical protein
MKLFKSSLLGAAVAVLGVGVAASPAAAQFYAYPRITNNDPAITATMSGVSWTGSYTPQIGNVAPGATGAGRLKTVSSFGYSGWSLTANLDDGVNPPKTCYFTFNLSNTTGALAAVGHVAGGGAICSNSGTTYAPYIYYTIE